MAGDQASLVSDKTELVAMVAVLLVCAVGAPFVFSLPVMLEAFGEPWSLVIGYGIAATLVLAVIGFGFRSKLVVRIARAGDGAWAIVASLVALRQVLLTGRFQWFALVIVLFIAGVYEATAAYKGKGGLFAARRGGILRRKQFP